MDQPLATHDYTDGGLEAAIAFFRRTRSELRTLRMVRVWRDRVQVFDVNGDYFEIRGIGYPDADVTTLLDAVNTAYKRESIHDPIGADYKELKTGRRYPWAADRVM